MNLANQRQHHSSDADLHSGIKDDRENTLIWIFLITECLHHQLKTSGLFGIVMDFLKKNRPVLTLAR